MALDIRIFTKNLDLNSDTESYIDKKLNRLERHLRPASDAKLELSRTSARSPSQRVVAQMTLSVNSYTLRGQERGPNVYAVIDAVIDVMDRQIQRYKGKIYRSEQAKRSGKSGGIGSDGPGALAEVEDEQEEPIATNLGRVVRTKRFPMKPMSVEDAILEMELVSHDFFLFYNLDSHEHNVVYRRRDGDYGIIEPELA